jgi:Holliday junction resolvase
MKPLSGVQAEREAVKVLKELLHPLSLHVERQVRPGPGQRADIVAQAGQVRFVIEVKTPARASMVAAGIEQLKAFIGAHGGNATPVLAVPYMGDLGKRMCADARVSWMDLSGNADIVAKGVRIRVEGKPNRYVERGRPSTAFAPKSARLTRCLLMEPTRVFAQRELASVAGLDDGFTSRVVRRLVEDKLIVREDGGIRVPDPKLLLDTWQESYDFNKHTITKAHITARSGEEGLHLLADGLRDNHIDYAATGLAGAWLHTEFAAFRLITVYVGEPLPDPLVETLGLRYEERGANVWIVEPNDIGVFHGSGKVKGVSCVHPVQDYLDLKAHPERASDAATELRARTMRWYL